MPSYAHDHWISRAQLVDPISGQWCCNHIDCEPVRIGGLHEQDGGYLVSETGEQIPYRRIIWQSQDGQWWRCRNLLTNKTRCLIGPPQGF